MDSIADTPTTKPMILVVDDSPLARRITGALLEQEGGCIALYAETGKQALKLLKEHQPTAVITDMNMPEMDGLELVERMHEDYPTIPVVLITAEGSEEIALKALRAGAASYVPKRNLARDLVEVLQQVLMAARQERRKRQLQGSLHSRSSVYDLENDPALVPVMVTTFQEELSAAGVCGPSQRIRVGVALEEALLNALYHGNLEVSSELKQRDDSAFHALANERRYKSPYKDRRLHVEAHVTRSEARYVIRDQGPGFDTANLPDPTDPEHLERPSGRGILLIRTFMSEVRYNKAGNELVMVKRTDS